MAHQEMLAEGFHPDFPAAVDQQVKTLESQSSAPAAGLKDLRSLLWSSIDNDTSRDLDQAEVAERVSNGIRVMVAIADVDSDVPIGSPIDQFAADQTTSVYTGVHTFSMLPEQLSTGLTSLNEASDRAAIVIDFMVASDGSVSSQGIYRALVRNQAQLTYNGVGLWLEGTAPAPAKVAASADLAAQLKLQDEAARILLDERQRMGALNIDRVEAEAVVTNGQVEGINTRQKNRASELIENFMVAANGVMARTLSAAGVSSIRRIVKTPERWPRIVELAARCGETLPEQPDSGALNAFLEKQKAKDAVHYADLSLAVVKLMGPGEYVLARAGDATQGHFALAAHDYTHSTAPNRRFADTVTQRLDQSRARQTARALFRRATGRHRAQLHFERGRRPQSGARHGQTHRRRGAAASHRPNVPGRGHRSYAQRHLRPRPEPARGRFADSRPARRRRRRSAISETGQHRSAPRLYRLRQVANYFFFPFFWMP